MILRRAMFHRCLAKMVSKVLQMLVKVPCIYNCEVGRTWGDVQVTRAISLQFVRTFCHGVGGKTRSLSKRYRATRDAVLVLAGLTFAPMATAQTAPAPSVSAVTAPTVTLASHRAVYNVSLVRASQRDGVRYTRGTMTYTLTDRCDGYTVESAMHLDMGMANGDDSELDQRYAAWEAKNNRSATFRMLTRENGAVKDSYHGEVTLDAKGAGKASYHGEQDVSFDLPEGTLLSTNHLVAVLDAAEKGEHFVNRPVIDGSFDDGPYRISAVVGPSRRDPVAVAQSGDLTRGSAWPLAMAYYQLESDEDAPAYELMMSVGPNGIARHLVQDFGGFTLAFDLAKVEPVAASPCGG